MNADKQYKRSSLIGAHIKQANGRLSFVDNRPIQQKLVQLKTAINDATMAKAASDIMGGESRSTLAITKEGATYKWYSQTNIGRKKTEISDNYSNLEQGVEGSGISGLHAEMVACGNSTNISAIAASQPICKRCGAYLDSQRIVKVNAGDQYTSNWIAPTMDNTPITSPYPGKARDDAHRDGKSGWRYIINERDYIPCRKADWEPHHPDGW